MRLRTVVWVAALLATFSASAAAQVTPGTAPVVYTPTGTYNLLWDAAIPSSTAPEDGIAGYTVVAASVVQTGNGTGVSLKTWDIGNVTSFALPGGQLPTGSFFVSVRARSVSGLVSQHSNTLPFQPAGTPSAPPNLRRATPIP